EVDGQIVESHEVLQWVRFPFLAENFDAFFIKSFRFGAATQVFQITPEHYNHHATSIVVRGESARSGQSHAERALGPTHIATRHRFGRRPCQSHPSQETVADGEHPGSPHKGEE